MFGLCELGGHPGRKIRAIGNWGKLCRQALPILPHEVLRNCAGKFGKHRGATARQRGEWMRLRRENTHTVERLRRSHDDLSHYVRALSHDMTANFMLLESSFTQLKSELADPSGPETNSAVAHVEACLRESKRFLDDLSDLARKGNVGMEPNWVDVADLVGEVLFEQRQPLADRGVEVEVERPMARAWCNRNRLKQVLSNLVRNAIKHGCDPQRPRIAISSVGEPSHITNTAKREFVAIRVHDNGPGIAPQFHEEIFVPGRRLADASSDGSGMGLAIDKKIAQSCGGTVWVESAKGKGTALVVLLPSSSEGVLEGRTPSVLPAGPEAQSHSIDGDSHDNDHRLRPHRPLPRRSGRHGNP
jgi:signal transduction histidine kinase